jgi:hypothetical protein
MSETDWKPGDVALATYDGKTKVYLRVRRDGFDQWESQDGTTLKRFEMADVARRLLVIDPESGEQIERLLLAYWENVTEPFVLSVEQKVAGLQSALRAMLEPPKPPKPDEPIGLGAVVVDGDGRRWTWAGEQDINDDRHWRQETSHLGRTYDRINAVEVLSSGVTA